MSCQKQKHMHVRLSVYKYECKMKGLFLLEVLEVEICESWMQLCPIGEKILILDLVFLRKV